MENLPDDEFCIQEDDNGDVPVAHEGYETAETEVIEINKTDNIYVNGHAGEPINLVVNNVVNVKGNDVFASFDRNFTRDVNFDDLLTAFNRDLEDCDVAIYRGTVQNGRIPFTAKVVTDINTRQRLYSKYEITGSDNITTHRLLKVEGDLVLKLPRNSALFWSESEFCNCPPVYTLKALRNNYEPQLEDLNDIAEPVAANNNIDLPYQLHQRITLNRNEGASLNASRETTLLPYIDRGLLHQNAAKRQYSPANLGNLQTPNYLHVIEQPQEHVNGMVTDGRQEEAFIPRHRFGSYLPPLRGTNNFHSLEKYSGHNAKNASVDSNKRFKSLEFNEPFHEYQSSKNLRGDPENTFLEGSLPKYTESGNASKMRVHNHRSNSRTCRILTKPTIKETGYSSKDVFKNVSGVDGALQRQQSGRVMSAGSSLSDYAPVQPLVRNDKAYTCMKGMGRISKPVVVNNGNRFPHLSSLEHHESFNNTRGDTLSTASKMSGHLSLSSTDTRQEKQEPIHSVGVQVDKQYPWDLTMNKKENRIQKHTAGATSTFHERAFKAPLYSKYYPAHALVKNNKMYAGRELPIIPARMNDRGQNGYGQLHLQASTSRYHPYGVQIPQNSNGYRVQPNGPINCQCNAQNSSNMQYFCSSNFGRHNNNSRMNEYNSTGLQRNDSRAQQGYIYPQNKPFTTTRYYPNAQ